MPSQASRCRSQTKYSSAVHDLTPRELALEIVRRARARAGHAEGFDGIPYVVRLSDPVTASERLQLAAARLLRTPIAIMPHRCKTTDEWMERYAKGGPS